MHKFSTSPILSLKLLRSQRQQKHSTAGTRAAYCNALAFGKNSRPPRSRRSFRNRSSGHRSFVVWSQFTHAAPQVRFRAAFRRRCTLTPSPKHRRVTSRLCQPTLSLVAILSKQGIARTGDAKVHGNPLRSVGAVPPVCWWPHGRPV